MYDSIHFRLQNSEATGIDFLNEIPQYLDNIGEHYYNDEAYITGELKGLKISINRFQIKIKDGSLCKWFLGDNIQTMGRSDTKRAIEKLSDTLHIPINKAHITRMDIAQNFITKHPIEVYLSHLGELKHFKRLEEPNGIYYSKTDVCLCFYDKIRELKSHNEEIPDMYNCRNVLRYEQRYTKRIASRLKVNEITGAMLYDEDFYINLLSKWKETYNAINKINDVSLNFQGMKTKQQLYKMGVLSLIEQAGGQLQMIRQINEAQKRGELSKKQAFDLRKAIKDISDNKEGLTIQNEAILELNRKINEAVKYYR